jgi:hypothetical protein
MSEKEPQFYEWFLRQIIKKVQNKEVINFPKSW